MKKLFVLFLFFCLSVPVGLSQAADAGKGACGDALSARILELFKDADETVSLGAMLVCDQVGNDECLVQYVIASRSPSDSLRARTVKNYYLAVTRYFDGPGKGYARTFINEFPEDPKGFADVLAFDASLTRTVAGRMIMEIVDSTDCRHPASLRKTARAKVERLRTTQDKAGWASEILPDSFPVCGK